MKVSEIYTANQCINSEIHNIVNEPELRQILVCLINVMLTSSLLEIINVIIHKHSITN